MKEKIMSHSSSPLSPSLHHQRPLIERAFTIRNIQTIAKYVCRQPLEGFQLAYVNQSFFETMNDFHTAGTIFFRLVSQNIKKKSARIDFVLPFFIRVTRARVRWLIEELLLKTESLIDLSYSESLNILRLSSVF